MTADVGGTGTESSGSYSSVQLDAYSTVYYQIDNPLAIASMVLTFNPQLYSGGTGAIYGGGFAYFDAIAYGVDRESGPFAYAGEGKTFQAFGGQAFVDNLLTTCTRAHVCTHSYPPTNMFSLALQASDVNEDGVFALSMSVRAFTHANYNWVGPDEDFTVSSTVMFDGPTITLYDANGVDVTDEHSVSTSAVVTPEPVSVALMGTGLLLIGTFSRRGRGFRRSEPESRA